jgi:hypothetical protein
MPISLAASSQTQMGSTPSSNFRQRLSQSIIGTKQLKVEVTNSGAPFFIHTRNRAGCSPSLVQEVGLRICSFSGQTPALDSRSQCCVLGAIGGPNTSQKIALQLAPRISAVKTIQLPNMRNVMHICAYPSRLVLVRRVAMSLKKLPAIVAVRSTSMQQSGAFNQLILLG